MKSKIRERIKERLSSDRYQHSLGVAATAVSLAKRYQVDPEKAELAALLHDYGKSLSPEELWQVVRDYQLVIDDFTKANIQLLHGEASAIMAKEEFGIEDEEILQAIRSHTLGRLGMSTLEKIVFLADFIEPNRTYPGVASLRRLAEVSLEEAIIAALQGTIAYVKEQGRTLHPMADTLLRHMLGESIDG